MKKFIAIADGYFEKKSRYGASSLIIFNEDESAILHQKSVAAYFRPTTEKLSYSRDLELAACLRAIESIPEGSELVLKMSSPNTKKSLIGKETKLGLVSKFRDIAVSRDISVGIFVEKAHEEKIKALREMAIKSFSNNGSAIVATKNLCKE